MGAYLSSPETSKESEEGKFKSSGIQFAVSTMQGWRRTQEDAHIVEDLGDGTTVLGVFDGHGGREVSNFAKRHFSRVLKEHKDFRSDVGAALIGAFHGIDQLLEDKANLPEVNSLKLDANDPSDDSQPGGSSSADDDNEAADGEGADGRKVSMSEAVDLFQKLMTLKRMNAAGAPSSEEGGGGARGSGGAGAGGAGAADGGGGGPPSRLLSGGGFGDGPRVCTLPQSHVDAGATSVVMAVRGGYLVVANAGDSRAIVSRKGRALALSEDHKPALPTELQRIQKAGGWVTAQGRINGNLNLSRALGDLKYKGDKSLPRAEQIITAQPDITKHKLEKGDEFVVLACDGVWDCMTNQEVVDFVSARLKRKMSLKAIIEEILDHCLAEDPRSTGGIGGDNMTCIIATLPH